MKILSLNCQRGYQSGLKSFLHKIMIEGSYEFILLQEFAKEVPNFVRNIPSYNILEFYNQDIGHPAQTCILYKDNYQLLEKNYLPIPRPFKDPVVGFKHSTFGSLLARFKKEEKIFLLGSIHLHSGINYSERIKQVSSVKEQVVSVMKEGDLAIFGGDCNFGFPGERIKAESILKPEFLCVTRTIGSTLDGRYSENVPHLPNRIAHFLGKLGIPTRLSTDHLFIDSSAHSCCQITSRVLPDRVSDHSPVEFIIE